jgi:hypothetical protein
MVHLDSNAAVHYDIALKGAGVGGNTNVRLQSWREL